MSLDAARKSVRRKRAGGSHTGFELWGMVSMSDADPAADNGPV